MEPWNWETPNCHFELSANNGNVTRILRISRIKYDDTTTKASNRLVTNGSAFTLPHRHSQTYTFVERILGTPNYLQFRDYMHDMRSKIVQIERVREKWRHPDGDIVKKYKQVGGIAKVHYTEEHDYRWVASITFQITKDAREKDIINA